MQIKRFEARNMTTALRLIKDELGPDAVILSARSIKRGKGILGSLRTSGVEVTAAVDGHYPLINRQVGPRLDRRLSADSADAGGSLPAATRLTSIQPAARVDLDKTCRNSGNKDDETSLLARLRRSLVWNDVDRDVVAEFMDEIKGIPRIEALTRFEQLVSHFVKVLDGIGICAGGLQPQRGRPQVVALIGVSGVGKTTTLAKLAAQQTHEHQRRVAVLSLDNVRIGAVHQIQRFSRIIGTPLQLAANPAELEDALQQFADQDLILIDTPAIYSAGGIAAAELLRLLVAKHGAEIHLLTNAATREADFLAVVERIKQVPVHRLVFTKLDETTRFGSILNVLVRTQIPLAYLGTGPAVPEDLEEGTARQLTEVLCRQELALEHFGREFGGSASANEAGAPPKAEAQPAVVANKNSDVYHVTGCKWAKRIKPVHLITFESRQAAEAQRFTPCQNCCVSQDEMRKFKDFPRDRVRIPRYY